MLTGNRVVVTGLGVLAANGTGKDAFWRTLVAGESGIAPVTLFDPCDLPCRIGGEVKGFDHRLYIDPKLKPDRRMSRGSQLGIAAARLALKDAGISLAELKQWPEVCILMGVSSSAMDLFAKRPTLWTASASVPHAAGSAIAAALDLDAKLTTLSDGCASGLDALGWGASEIQRGRQDVVMAGAADSAMTRYVFEGFGKSRKLSTRNEDPERASRPFDRDRDGGVISEGAGVVILENLEHAMARGGHVYAEVTGYGQTADRSRDAVGSGMARSMRLAMANACCRPEHVEHISAHAPSDEHMDRTESGLIQEVFGVHAHRMSVVSIKGVTGNPMSVGGTLQFIAAALTLEHEVVPPTANLERPGKGCDLDYVSGRARPQKVRMAMVNTHGFGRGNASLILERPRGDAGERK